MRRPSLVLLPVLLVAAPGGARAVSRPAPSPHSTVAFATPIEGDPPLVEAATEPDGRLRRIVRLVLPSVAEVAASLPPGTDPAARAAALRAAARAIDLEQERFRADLRAIEADLGRAPGSAATVTISVRSALDAVALVAERAVVERIARLPGVRAVEPDLRVEASDAASFAVLGLPCFRAAHPGVTGRGVRVGVIDTGIDYTHPDLGGGFGPGFKVAGGHDFVNGDPDPLDDNGHGTHVAGIVAAGGSTEPGVAPDATLYAYKVLDANGYGLDSGIIAAIDRSVDPDQDPGTDDALDVINLSLGGPGNGTDALSAAVDNASAAGVVAVVAAGNSGPGYYTVGSPGAALEALTAGASDDADQVAWFSSRGWGDRLYNIKPDVTAPGVGINSTWPGGGYRSASGTSMAAPHVAGMAALLRELHPGWSPRVVKAVVMQAARDLGRDIWTQGKGRADLCRAPAALAAVTPGSVSFGLDPCVLPVWTPSQELTLHNFDAVPRDFVLSVDPTNVPAGVTFAFAPETLTVAPGASATSTFTMTVDNAVTPFGAGTPPAWNGLVRATSQGDVLTLPFAFVKMRSLVLDFDEEPYVVFLHDRAALYQLHAYPGRRLVALLPPGVYDIIVVYEDVSTKVVREGVSLSGCVTPLSIAKAEAFNRFDIELLDPAGAPFGFFENWGGHGLRHRASSMGLAFLGPIHLGATPQQFRLSNLSDAYTYQLKLQHQGADRDWDYHDFNFELASGVLGGGVLRNDPTAFRRVDFTYDADPAVRSLYYHQRVAYRRGGRLSEFYPTWNRPELWMSPPFAFRSQFYSPLPGAEFDYVNVHRTYDTTSVTDPYQAPVYHRAAFPEQSAAGKLTFSTLWDFANPTFVTSSPSVEVNVSRYAPRWTARTANRVSGSETTIRTYRYPQVSYFLDVYGDLRISSTSTPTWEAFFAGASIGSGTLWNDFIGPTYEVELAHPALGPYALEVKYRAYEIAGLPGMATARLEFDTSLPTRDEPSLSHFSVRADDRFAETLSFGAYNEVVLAGAPQAGTSLASVRIYTQPLGGGRPWRDHGAWFDGSHYRAPFYCHADATHYSVRVVLEDSGGGRLDYRVEPGFAWAGPCPELGACCLGSSCALRDKWQCVDEGGNFLGTGTSCGPDGCRDGACCHGDDECVVTSEPDCDSIYAGCFRGGGSTCEVNPCPWPGPCW